MIQQWKDNINQFIQLANQFGVKMLMVGGGAVNFHGYQRYSADVDFWIDTTAKNLENLIRVFQEMGYDIDSFPDDVKNQNQNISIKFSPEDLDLELIGCIPNCLKVRIKSYIWRKHQNNDKRRIFENISLAIRGTEPTRRRKEFS